MAKTYAVPKPSAWLLSKLRTQALKQGRDPSRLRQLLVFDRFLAPVFHQLVTRRTLVDPVAWKRFGAWFNNLAPRH